jgi:nitrile hydratase
MSLPEQRGPFSIIPASGEIPAFDVGDEVQVSERYPIGHYRVPVPIRGRRGVVVSIISPNIDNEEEAYGRNAGSRRHYHRVSIPLRGIWGDRYVGSPKDCLRIEIFETWLTVIK